MKIFVCIILAVLMIVSMIGVVSGQDGTSRLFEEQHKPIGDCNVELTDPPQCGPNDENVWKYGEVKLTPEGCDLKGNPAPEPKKRFCYKKCKVPPDACKSDADCGEDKYCTIECKCVDTYKEKMDIAKEVMEEDRPKEALVDADVKEGVDGSVEPKKEGFFQKILNWFRNLFGGAPEEDQQIVPPQEAAPRRELSIVATINQKLQEPIGQVLKVETKMERPDPTLIADVADKISRLPENQRDSVINNIKNNIQNYKNPFNNPNALTEIFTDISNELDTAIPKGVIPTEGFITGVSPGLTTGDQGVVQEMVEGGFTNVIPEGVTSPFIFTVVNTDGTPAPGEGVTLESIPPLVTFSPKSGTTDENGEFKASGTFPKGILIEKIMISGTVTTSEDASVPSAGIIIVSDVFQETVQEIADRVTNLNPTGSPGELENIGPEMIDYTSTMGQKDPGLA